MATFTPKDTGSLKTKIRAAENSPEKMNNEKHRQNESTLPGKRRLCRMGFDILGRAASSLLGFSLKGERTAGALAKEEPRKGRPPF